MFLKRTLAPAAAPLYARDMLAGLAGSLRGRAELKRFGSELQDYFDVRHCFLLSSGKASLTVLLKALKDLYPGRDEVLIPAYTCFSVPSAVIRAGLKVRLCDIDPQTLDFDFAQLARIFGPSGAGGATDPQRLLAVIAVHLFGMPCDIGRLSSMIRDPEVAVIEDAAQAMGGEGAGRKLGTIGDAGIFSLGRGKALSTGEGGIIVTRRSDIAEKIKSIFEQLPHYSFREGVGLFCKALTLSIFIHPLLFWFPRSLRFLRLGQTLFEPGFQMKKMSAFQAGLAGRWRKKLIRFQNSRMRNTRFWTALLKPRPIEPDPASPGQEMPAGLSILTTSAPPHLIRFPLLVAQPGLREQMIALSERLGLGIMPGYPDSINHIPEIRELFFGQEFPAAQETARELITLPVHALLAEPDRVKIARLIRIPYPHDAQT